MQIGTRRIAAYNGKLRTFRECRRGSITPFQTIRGNDDHMLVGRRYRERHPTCYETAQLSDRYV